VWRRLRSSARADVFRPFSKARRFRSFVWMFPSLLQDRSKQAEFAVMERTRIANCTNEFRPELSFVSSLRYKIKYVQIRSLTGSDRSDRFRRFKRSATDLTFFFFFFFFSSLLELVPLPSRFSGLWYFGRERSPRGFQSSQDCGDAPRASAHHHPPVVVIASSTTTPKCRLRLKRRWSTNRPKCYVFILSW
jgi:hypothetical protein